MGARYSLRWCLVGERLPGAFGWSTICCGSMIVFAWFSRSSHRSHLCPFPSPQFLYLDFYCHLWGHWELADLETYFLHQPRFSTPASLNFCPISFRCLSWLLKMSYPARDLNNYLLVYSSLGFFENEICTSRIFLDFALSKSPSTLDACCSNRSVFSWNNRIGYFFELLRVGQGQPL